MLLRCSCQPERPRDVAAVASFSALVAGHEFFNHFHVSSEGGLNLSIDGEVWPLFQILAEASFLWPVQADSQGK